ncbi:hypothetical protein LZS97_18570 [Vibrio fluvialis]|uniref:hypothetical protein n=1 Tax=Vibrio fluvialis TaxID=676 RepID=UPI001F3737DD|nr:hypothetical protein [Vibrio fluvialis]MCE7612203.1 hypothetical protein [Vibrio fluvialis]MCE7620922.1 hypothetical protein [Vibrio fluvialis]MCE7626440.1 hypothetical protein [Vibrio fluvialis]
MDWNELAARYTDDHQETRISLKQWCKQHQINYQNARKHISVREAKASSSNMPKTKRQNVINPQPNKANHTSFTAGNQAARKHGAYSELLDCNDVDIAIKAQSLDDELLVCRARLASVLKTRFELQAQWQQCSSVESKIQLSEVLYKLVDAEERTIARIESLHATISKLKRNETTVVKEAVQTKLIEQTIRLKTKDEQRDDKVIFNINW